MSNFAFLAAEFPAVHEAAVEAERQAAEAHGGFAEATNAPGGGAVLRVSFGPALPLADEPESEPATAIRLKQRCAACLQDC